MTEDILNKISYWGQHTFVLEPAEVKGFYSITIYRNIPKVIEVMCLFRGFDEMKKCFDDNNHPLKLFANSSGHSNFEDFLNSFKYNIE